MPTPRQRFTRPPIRRTPPFTFSIGFVVSNVLDSAPEISSFFTESVSSNPSRRLLAVLADGAEPLAERTLRAVALAGTWAEQRAAWPG